MLMLFGCLQCWGNVVTKTGLLNTRIIIIIYSLWSVKIGNLVQPKIPTFLWQLLKSIHTQLYIYLHTHCVGYFQFPHGRVSCGQYYHNCILTCAVNYWSIEWSICNSTASCTGSLYTTISTNIVKKTQYIIHLKWLPTYSNVLDLIICGLLCY